MSIDKHTATLNAITKAWQNANEDVYVFTNALRKFGVKMLKTRFGDKILQAPDMEQGQYFITSFIPWSNETEQVAIYRLVHGDVYARDNNGDVRRLDPQYIESTELLWLYEGASDWEEINE